MISVADVVQPTQDTTPVQTPTAAAAADAVKSNSNSSNASTPVYTSTGSSSISSSSTISSANSAMAIVTHAKATRRHNESASRSESETASIALEEIQAELMQVLRLQQQRVEAAEHKLGHAIVLHDTSIEPGIGTASDLPRLTGPDAHTLTDHHKERSETTKVDAPVELNERVRSRHASHHAASRHTKGVKKEAVDMSHNTKDTARRHQPHIEENTKNVNDDLAERPGSPLFHPRGHTRGVGQDTHTHVSSSELAKGAVELPISGEGEVTCGSPIYHEVDANHNNNNNRESGDGSNSPEYERFLAQLKDQQRQHHEVLRKQRAMRAAAAAAMPHTSHTINNEAAQDNENENRNNEEVEEEGGGEAATLMRQGLRFVRLYSHDQACRSPPLALMHHVVGTPSSVENGNERNNVASSSVTGQAIEISSQRPVMRLDVHWQKDTVNVTPVRNRDVSRPFAMGAAAAAGTPLLAPPPQLLVTSTNDTVSENSKADENIPRLPYDNKQQHYTSDKTNASAEVNSSTSTAGEEGNVRNERRQAGRLKLSPVEPFADVLLSDNARHQRRDRHTEQQQHNSSNAGIARPHKSAILSKPGAMNASVLHNEANEGNTDYHMASRTRGPSSSLIPEHGTVTPHSARLGRTLTQHKHQQQQINGGVAQNALAGVRHNNTSRPISTAALRRAVEALWQERGASRHRKPFHGIHTHTTQGVSIAKSPSKRVAAERPSEIDRQLLQTGSAAREHDTHLISYLPHNAAVTTITATKAKVTPHDEEGDARAVNRYHFADSLVGAALADVFPDLRRRQRDVQRHVHSPRTSRTDTRNTNGIVGPTANDMGLRKHDVDIGGSAIKREQRKAAPHTSDEYYYYYDRGFRPVPSHLSK